MSRLKFRTWNPRFKEFNYWGFMGDHFTGPPTGSGLTIEECSKSDCRIPNVFDHDGKQVWENDLIRLEYYTHAEVHEKGGHSRLVTANWDQYGKYNFIAVDGRPGGPWGTLVGKNKVVKTFRVVGSVQANPELIISEKVAARLNREDKNDEDY